MNAKQTQIAQLIQNQPMTAAAIAECVDLSVSRVRELLKDLPKVERSGGKPARFFISVSGWTYSQHVVDEAAAGNPEAETEVEDGGCPFCGADHSSTTAAGEEGTFLGDSCNFCHVCSRAWNIVTKEEVDVNAKAKRTPLNPQPRIDKKVAAIEEAGGTLVFEHRLWVVTLGKKAFSLTSRQFAQLRTPEQFIEFVKTAEVK